VRFFAPYVFISLYPIALLFMQEAAQFSNFIFVNKSVQCVFFFSFYLFFGVEIRGGFEAKPPLIFVKKYFQFFAIS
jgi:hypothetical protein